MGLSTDATMVWGFLTSGVAAGFDGLYWNLLLHGNTRMPVCSFIFFNAKNHRSKLEFIPLLISLLWTDPSRASAEPLCVNHELESRQMRLKSCSPQSGQKLLKSCPLLIGICWFTPSQEGKLSSPSFNASELSCKQLYCICLILLWFFFFFL